MFKTVQSQTNHRDYFGNQMLPILRTLNGPDTNLAILLQTVLKKTDTRVL